MRAGFAIVALAIGLLADALPAFGQSPAAVRVTGTFGVSGQGESLLVTFSCTGTPTCVGQFNLVERTTFCSNTIVESNAFTMTGLNLAQSGPLQGTLTLAGAQNSFTVLPDGTCVVAPGATDAVVPYTAIWDLATGTASIIVTDDERFPGTFTADFSAPPPVFPMTVRSTITAVSATVTADIQFRAQDVGRNGSVYVFASAPQTQVRNPLAVKVVQLGMARPGAKAESKGGPKAVVPCVLAQVSPQGQLVAVSLAQLQAFTTGAFAAAGASVSILNNAPTPNVASATFYVGYGPTGTSMLNEGIFRNAVLIPGNDVCPPLPYMTSLWWNPAEPGWGLNLNQQGGIMFGTIFVYGNARQPRWLVMSAGALQADGVTFVGDLYATTGPPFNANPFTPIGPANISRVGTMSINFSDANAATLTYNVDSRQVQKSIQRQVFGARAANCLPTVESRATSTNYQDLWWNPNESGWGVNVAHQDNTLFATLFTYDAAGRDIWLVMSAGVRQPDGSYLGDLFRTAGSVFNAVPSIPLSPADITNVGTMRLRFTDGNNGTLTYTFNGTQVVKAITRQVFSSPASLCN